MPGPTFTFGFILATLYGATFHLLMGGGARRLVFFMFAAWIGFPIGHIVGVVFDVGVFVMGALQFTAATVGAFVLMWAAHLLTADDLGRNRRNTRKR